MLKFDELPCTPETDRILVQPDPPEEKSIGGILIPDAARMQACMGRLLDAGLKARDILYDNGNLIGDRILYGQFAGAWEEWDHIVKAGKKVDCAHDGTWSYEASLTGFRRQGHKCDQCGALRQREPVLIMNVGDILANISKAERVNSGSALLVRCTTFDGKTQHVFRKDTDIPAPEVRPSTNGVTHAS